MRQQPPATTVEARTETRLKALERRLTTLERNPTVTQVTGWSSTATAAPFGTVVYDTGTSRLWVSVGATWKYVVLS